MPAVVFKMIAADLSQLLLAAAAGATEVFHLYIASIHVFLATDGGQVPSRNLDC